MDSGSRHCRGRIRGLRHRGECGGLAGYGTAIFPDMDMDYPRVLGMSSGGRVGTGCYGSGLAEGTDFSRSVSDGGDGGAACGTADIGPSYWGYIYKRGVGIRTGIGAVGIG